MLAPRNIRSACRPALPLALAAALVVSGAGLNAATAATTDPNPSAREQQNAELSRRAATEGMVLLENADKALPMASSGKVAVFGVGAYKTVKGGTGSGDVNNRYAVTVRQGLENAGYKITTSPAYWDAMTAAYDAKYGTAGGSLFGPAIDYSSVEQPLTDASVTPTASTDTALFVVARNSGEGADRTSGAGDYELTAVEKANIEKIGKTYKHVVVVLNVGGVVDTTFYGSINAAAKDPAGGKAVDSLLLMSQAGQESGNALVDVLDGTVNPSGRLTDTWAAKYADYPAAATFGANDGNTTTEDYSEGVYVGYRYFDSFEKSIDPGAASPVAYPFGYGLSYTDFAVRTQGVTADMNTVTVRAKVTNTGKVAGRQVVQVYVSAPQKGLDKPYQQLAGYAKTDLLAPGQSQVVTIAYDTTSMASYDESRSSYVMDKGTYVVRVGDSSRGTHVAARLTLDKTLVTEKLSAQMDDNTPADELTSDPKSFWSYDGEADEIAAAPAIVLSHAGFTPEKNASKLAQNVTVGASSPYAAIDGKKISSTTAYVDRKEKDWEDTGAPYAAKTGEKVKKVTTDPDATLYDVADGSISMEQLVAGLSIDQLANIVEGASAPGSTKTAIGAAGYTTAKYEDLGLPGMILSDGPAGLRLTQQISSTPKTYQYATAFPVGTLLAQSWDRALVEKVGVAIGQEMAEFGVTMWLAPGMNIHRDPLNGRNFEYYSEDPLLSGLTAAAATDGVQTTPGVGVTIKHFVANNQEVNRNAVDDVVSERAMREIYLKGFEIAVRSAQPMAVMSSYNKVNGTWSASSYDLLTDVLRGEWGFGGLVMTDWGGNHDAVATMYSGNDLIEPGGNTGEIVNNIKMVDPTVDVSGLPAYNKTTLTFGTFSFVQWNWQLGGLALAADGTQTISTTVDSSTDLTKVPLSGETTTDAINNQVFTPLAPFASVDAAYKSVNEMLAGTAFTAAQKAGITLTGVQHADAADATSPVTAYTLNLKGSYPARGFAMRLGDLQRSATRVLDVAMHTAGYEELAGINGVDGVTVGSWTGRFDDLDTFVTDTRSAVVTEDTTRPTVTVKDGSAYTVGSDGVYSKVSFKLYDAGKIDRLTLNGVTKDLTDNAWSDLNYVTPGAFGAVKGKNTLVVYDVAGNSTTVTFKLTNS